MHSRLEDLDSGNIRKKERKVITFRGRLPSQGDVISPKGFSGGRQSPEKSDI